MIDHSIVADEVEFWMQVADKASMDLANKEKEKKIILKICKLFYALIKK